MSKGKLYMNENNKLVRFEDVNQEMVNNYLFSFSTVTVKEFLLYYSWILQIVYQEKIISEEHRNEIANMIVNSIDMITSCELGSMLEDNTVQIANYLYIITLYLSEKSNWDSWLELRQVTDFDSAKEFCLGVKKWFISKLSKEKLLLDSSYKYVQKINITYISETYNKLKNMVCKFKAFDRPNVVSFKQYHDMSMDDGIYICLSKRIGKSLNCFERLVEQIYAFNLETSILAIVDFKHFYNAMKQETEGFEENQNIQIFEIDDKYEKLLKDLLDNKNKKLDYYYQSLHRPGRKRKGCADEIEIENLYRIQKAKIEKRWEMELESNYKMQEEERFNTMEALNEFISLRDFIKQYYVFSLSKRGAIEYPSTQKELNNLLVNIPMDRALDEFLREFSLSDVQTEYLKENLN